MLERGEYALLMLLAEWQLSLQARRPLLYASVAVSTAAGHGTRRPQALTTVVLQRCDNVGGWSTAEQATLCCGRASIPILPTVAGVSTSPEAVETIGDHFSAD
jgi:hypothetical protein